MYQASLCMIGLRVNVMEKNRSAYKLLLLVSGIIIGGGLGVLLYTNTGIPSSLLLTNVGAAIGIAFGANLDETR
jgi:phosphate/sulfate permease